MKSASPSNLAAKKPGTPTEVCFSEIGVTTELRTTKFGIISETYPFEVCIPRKSEPAKIDI